MTTSDRTGMLALALFVCSNVWLATDHTLVGFGFGVAAVYFINLAIERD